MTETSSFFQHWLTRLQRAIDGRQQLLPEKRRWPKQHHRAVCQVPYQEASFPKVGAQLLSHNQRKCTMKGASRAQVLGHHCCLPQLPILIKEHHHLIIQIGNFQYYA
ncbi:Os05g0353200 [Oryza sativa Japonica Group]|uniref:Os05g0353200 protein n=1 Tax=Oryza sativa subsp. japonica TaxID=39947 RepID=A0A0P0WL30_ORYSJ|nr:hypothetical protein EE612_028867 [Oryza sativa]BAS93550.1 Os05g0353200 [Oryza sativa Japonica Group]